MCFQRTCSWEATSGKTAKAARTAGLTKATDVERLTEFAKTYVNKDTAEEKDQPGTPRTSSASRSFNESMGSSLSKVVRRADIGTCSARAARTQRLLACLLACMGQASTATMVLLSKFDVLEQGDAHGAKDFFNALELI